MTVYFEKARDRWRHDFEMRGERYQGYAMQVDAPTEYAKGERQAQAWQEQVRARARLMPGAAKAVKAAPGVYTLAHAFSAFGTTRRQLDSWKEMERHIAAALEFFGPAAPAASIDKGWCNRWIEKMQATACRTYVGGPGSGEAKGESFKAQARMRSAGTINRYLNTLRAALNEAHESRDPLTNLPLIPARADVPRLRETERQPRPVPDAVLAKLVYHATRTAPHVADAAMLMRYTGMRSAETFGLTVSHVDLEAAIIWLRGEETKGNRDEAIPIPRQAVVLVERLVAQAEERGTPYLFAYRPRGEAATWQRIARPKRAWATACKAAGVTFRMHDIKASFVTDVGRRASAATTRSLARHKSATTTARYLAVIDMDRRAAADGVAFMESPTVSPTGKKRVKARRPSGA
jgi:integrase